MIFFVHRSKCRGAGKRGQEGSPKHEGPEGAEGAEGAEGGRWWLASTEELEAGGMQGRHASGLLLPAPGVERKRIQGVSGLSP